MSTNNSNDYDYTEREKKVLELYKKGKRTRHTARNGLSNRSKTE